MIKIFALIALVCSVFVSIFGCVSGFGNRDQVAQDKVFFHKKEILPTGSPARSHLAENIYRYYPEKNIYYDVKKGLYYYLKGDRWISSTSIPAVLSPNIGGYITIEMDTDKPYQYHDEVQEKYSFAKRN